MQPNSRYKNLSFVKMRFLASICDLQSHNIIAIPGSRSALARATDERCRCVILKPESAYLQREGSGVVVCVHHTINILR